MVTALALTGSLEAPIVVLIDIKRAFAGNGKNIRLPMKEVVICAAAGDLSKSKKFWEWMSRNAILLPPFLAEAIVNDGEIAAEALLKTFAEKILIHKV